MKKKMIVSLMLAIGLLIGIQATSHATPTLQLISGVTTITVGDGDLLDVNPVVGAVTFVGAVGPWTLNVSTGVTKPQLGSAALPHLDVNSINQTGVGGTLDIFFSETGYTGTPISGSFLVGGTLNGGVGSSAAFSAYFDNGDALFALSNLLGTLGPFGSGAFSATTGISGDPTSPYSLTMNAHLVGVGATIASFDNELQGKVPEPISLILLGSGLAGAGLYRRIRKPRG